MSFLGWKVLLGAVAAVSLVAAEVGADFFHWSDKLMAPTCALIAAVAHSATLISGGRSTNSRVVDLSVRGTLVLAVLLSATHWLRTHDSNSTIVEVLPVIGLVGVVVGLAVALDEAIKVGQSGPDGSGTEGQPDHQ